MAEENKNVNTEAEEQETCTDAPECEKDNECPETAKEKKGTKQLKGEIETLKAKLAETEKSLEALKAEASDKYARLAAEYDNFRRRSQKEREGVYGEAVADTVMGIVPIIDNLMYAEKFGGGEDNLEKFAEGVKLILGKLPETLEKMNVTVFGKVGETFDPNLHNAVMHVEDEAYGEGEIVDVLQCGYKYGDRVIRYAMVRVAN